MNENNEVKGAVTRRNFMKGALAAAAAMGVGAVASGCGPTGGSDKKDVAATAENTATADYQNIYKDGVSLMPSRKAPAPAAQSPLNREKSPQTKLSAPKTSTSLSLVPALVALSPA